MKANFIPAPASADRLATVEEIQAAVLVFSEQSEERTPEIFHEFPLDAGGYVRISAEEFKTALMLEEFFKEEDL